MIKIVRCDTKILRLSVV